MILVDASVWIAYLKNERKGNVLGRLLLTEEDNEIRTHPVVIGELYLGGLPAGVKALLAGLAVASVATHGEVLELIEGHPLIGRGVGYTDAHLLASARLTGAGLWTFDASLAAVAGEMGCSYLPA